MLRLSCCACLALLALAGLVVADQVKGKVKSVNAEKGSVTVTVGKDDREFAVAASAKVLGSDGKELKDRLKNKAFTAGAPISVTVEKEAVTEVKVGYPPNGFLDADSAGPDFAVQGEYEGTVAGKKWGAEVIAQNAEGQFQVQFLAGGLPGAGWDGKTIVKGTAVTADGKTAVSGEWKGSIADGKLTGKTSDGAEFTLSHVLRGSPTMGAKPPSGAIVLFDGSNVDEWPGGQLVEGKYLLAGPKSKRAFQDFKLHLEFRMPFRDRSAGNSGVYIQERYEIQIINSFGHLPARNNGCGSIYTARAEDVNMTLPPLAWQSYDIDFTAPRWDEQGKKTKNAVVTVLHNGVVVHDKAEVKDKTGAGKPEGPSAAPIYLQNHGSPVYFRNIWVVAP